MEEPEHGGVEWWWVLLLLTQVPCMATLASQGVSVDTSWVCVCVGIVRLERYGMKLTVFQKKTWFGPSTFSGSTMLQFLQQHPPDSSGTTAGFCRALSLLVPV